MTRSFSERRGLVIPSREIQTDGMTDELRISLWNVLDVAIWSDPEFQDFYGEWDLTAFSTALWLDHFKRALDRRPSDTSQIYLAIRKHFFTCKWNEVYDFVEFTIRWKISRRPGVGTVELENIGQQLNRVLERELAGYRFIEGTFIQITDSQEVAALEQALADKRYPGVQAHLEAALRLLSDRKQPDYRNSIKESISAVESMAKAITGKDKASLGDALVELEQRGAIHAALKRSFSSLYGYASDEGGIRHAMLEEPNLTAADAKFFLLSCTSFINYLKAKL